MPSDVTYNVAYVRTCKSSARSSAVMLTCLKLKNAYAERSLGLHRAYQSSYPTSISYPSLIT